MSEILWLPAPECPLLRPEAEVAPAALRQMQRLLELTSAGQGAADLARALLGEIAQILHADSAAIHQAPHWDILWQHQRAGAKPSGSSPPRSLLSEVLDREAGSIRPPTASLPAFALACLSYTESANRVLLVSRSRSPFQRSELEYVVAAGHYLGLGLERARYWDHQAAAVERLQALVAVGQELAEDRETGPLLEHIAAQAVRLLHCERASIFLHDKPRKELVGRPALGLPNNELRVPEHSGIVGRVLQSGRPCQVDAVQEESGWNSQVDAQSGFRTRNLLCVPLNDMSGTRIGVLEVLNRKEGRFTEEDAATLQTLAGHAVLALRNVREREALLRVNAEHEGRARLGARIIGESPAIKALRSTLERVAPTDLPVLILGESGSGKEVVARAIHYNGPRFGNPFLPVNCAAIAETLLESELFGHEKGAFTDAHATRPGKFELAGNGTLFLDEVGDMSAGGQAKLLRVLEEKSLVRVGGSQSIPVDARIVAATNRNLAEAVRTGKFRQDLYYRLTVVTLDLPALRERPEDILPLAEFFLEGFRRDAGRPQLTLSEDARRRLREHDWPGNVRELRNLMERVAFLSVGDQVEASDLVFILKPTAAREEDQFNGLTLTDATDRFQIQHIRRGIERAGGNMTDAAKLLGMQRTNLYRKMKMLQMENS